MENKQLSRLIRIGNFDESGWRNEACQVVMRLVHPSAGQGSTVTLELPHLRQNEIKGVSCNRVEVRCENELPDEELLFNIDGQSLPLLDSISEVQRQIVDLEGRKISVKGIRFTNMYGLDDPRYLHGGMGIDFKVTKKDAPHIGDVARFLGARLFGTDQFVAHGQGFELALDGVRVLISVNQELGRGHISFEPTQAFENGATLLTLDAALLNLMRYPKPASSFTPQENPQRDQFIEFNSQTPFTLDDLLEKHAEAVPPATAPTLRVREEAMKAFTGQLGSGVPANQQHRRFHLLLRGKYPVLLTINAGNDVARWSIRLDMSRSFKNG
ncbi:MAG TPA: hypothetical protein VJC18_08550, partial [bacterium]|nr:hypothetical protein [bacterium]